MKIKELIALLETQDPEAEVLIMSQPNWPFEYALKGIAPREDFEELEDDEDPRVGGPRDGKRSTDVFLVEGEQLRYGSKAAWDAVY